MVFGTKQVDMESRKVLIKNNNWLANFMQYFQPI
jgi:hypothetical protein